MASIDGALSQRRGSAGKARRSGERQSSVVLQVVSHLATGAKHMIPEASHHKSVHHADVALSTYESAEYGTARYGSEHLVVELEGEAESQLGRVLTPQVLAGKALEYWQKHEALK